MSTDLTPPAEVIEAAAKALAGVEFGEDWPTNFELGGGPTGIRDDEFRGAMLDQARDAAEPLTQWGYVQGLQAAREAVLEIAPSLNAELRYDGTEDPGMGAYVEGFHDSLSAIDTLLAETKGNDHE